MREQPGRRRIHLLVDQWLGSVIEELARRIVAPGAEQGIQRTAQVSVISPGEVGEVVLGGCRVGVVVGEIEDRVMDRDVGVALGVGERVEPASA
jgi:hypothetical protein